LMQPTSRGSRIVLVERIAARSPEKEEKGVKTMTSAKRHQIRIVNERWEGKYNLVCDVIFEGRLNSNVKVEAYLPKFPNWLALKSTSR
jgi:hypothetical protein